MLLCEFWERFGTDFYKKTHMSGVVVVQNIAYSIKCSQLRKKIYEIYLNKNSKNPVPVGSSHDINTRNET